MNLLDHTIIESENLNELTYKCCRKILQDGKSLPSRNGSVLELTDVDLFLLNPRNRHLYLEGRKNNLYATLAETFWVMAGEDRLDPVMKFFIPRCVDFSDDGGKTWRGAYGPRIYINNQIAHVIQMFKKDSLLTRRATMTIWRPDMDTVDAIEDQGLEDSKDIPCSQWLGFWVRNNRLNCKFQMRSNDCIWGMSHINVFEFSFLQEVILELLKNELDNNDLDLGYYHHSTISLHLYDPGTASQARDILNNYNTPNLLTKPSDAMDLGELSYKNVLQFFEDIYRVICNTIHKKEEDISLTDEFDHWGVPTKNNQLFDYASLVIYKIKDKLKIPQDRNLILNHIMNMSSDLKKAVMHSKFTPKSWK